MKTNFKLLHTWIFRAVGLGIGSLFGLAAATENSAWTALATLSIPWSQLGAKAGVDPTFSDAKWSSMNPSIPGADGTVAAAVVDASGNLYIGGWFSVAGDVIANGVAKWDGSSWSALGSGMSGGDSPRVSALAVSGGAL